MHIALPQAASLEERMIRFANQQDTAASVLTQELTRAAYRRPLNGPGFNALTCSFGKW
jgi:hypothetical protein